MDIYVGQHMIKLPDHIDDGSNNFLLGLGDALALGVGRNAIPGFSFAGLMFPGGELLVRVICQPYF